jgi:serine protein kinase
MNVEAAYAFAQTGSIGGARTVAGNSDIFSLFSSAYARERRETMSLNDYLEGCRNDPGMTASAAERMITAIGDPVVVDTSKTRASAASSSIAPSRSIPQWPGSSAWRIRSSAS